MPDVQARALTTRNHVPGWWVAEVAGFVPIHERGSWVRVQRVDVMRHVVHVEAAGTAMTLAPDDLVPVRS